MTAYSRTVPKWQLPRDVIGTMSRHEKLLGPFCFFSISRGKHALSKYTKSLFNVAEINAAFGLYSLLVFGFHSKDSEGQHNREHMKGRICIISSYKEQVFQLKKIFTGWLEQGIQDEVGARLTGSRARRRTSS